MLRKRQWRCNLRGPGFKTQWPPRRIPTTPAHGLSEGRRRIDWAFIRGPLRACSGQVHGNGKTSDHYSISFVLTHGSVSKAVTEVGRKVPAGSCAIGPARGELKKSRRNRGALHGDFHGGETDILAYYGLHLHLDCVSFLLPFPIAKAEKDCDAKRPGPTARNAVLPQSWSPAVHQVGI